MQFTQTQALLSIILVSLIMFMMILLVIIISVRNFRFRTKQEIEKNKLINEIQEAEQKKI